MNTVLMTLILLALLVPAPALMIVSTAAGGNWNDANTWVGGVVPNLEDDVSILGTVFAPDPVGCHSLYIGANAALMNAPGQDTHLNVITSFTNYGSVSNYLWGYNPGQLRLYVGGNVSNFSSYSASWLYFTGATSQNFFSSGTINLCNMSDNNGISPVVLTSNLTLYNSNILMNGASLVLNGDSTYSLTGYGNGGVVNAVIVGGDGASIASFDGFHLDGVSADEIVLSGTPIITNSVSIGHLINQATLYCPIYGASTLNVLQRLDNHGSIMNHPSGGYLYLNLYGDLYNYGTLSNYSTSLAGTQIHNLWQSPSAPVIVCNNLTSSSTEPAQLLSDLSFNGTCIDMSGNLIILADALTNECYEITQTGGYIRNTVFAGGPTCALNLYALYLENVSADRITFNGNFELKSTVTADILTNNAILRNVAYQEAILSVTLDLKHHGELNNHGAGGLLYLALGGDFYDYGLLSNYRIDFVGGSQHQIWQSASAPVICTPNFFAPDAGNPVRLLSNLRLSGARFEFYGNMLILHDGRADFSLDLQNCRLIGVHLVGGNTSVLNGAAAFLQDSTSERIITAGTVFIAGTVSIGQLTNQGIMRNQDYWTSTLIVTQRLANYQSLTNSLYGGVLYLQLEGDLFNYGSFYLRQVFVNGTEDQYIRNAGSIITDQGFLLVSEIGPAQWYFNGALASSSYVTNLAVDPTQTGTWRPFLDGVWGRQVVFGEGTALTTSEIYSFAPFGALLLLTWSEVPGAVYYRVYSSPAPEGPFTIQQPVVLDPQAGDGQVGCTIQPANAVRFYRVSALN
ncbi:MAG TPA: hypothetical protein PKH19_01255 [Candidatus Syntrophosphaera sp.]|nr:hypothetical protein [Candidatus Syntrophosphaera sp.]